MFPWRAPQPSAENRTAITCAPLDSAYESILALVTEYVKFLRMIERIDSLHFYVVFSALVKLVYLFGRPALASCEANCVCGIGKLYANESLRCNHLQKLYEIH